MIQYFKNILCVITLLLWLAVDSHTASAQTANILYSMHPTPQEKSYYLSLNGDHTTTNVHELTGKRLSLMYENRTPDAKRLEIDICDWKLNVLKVLTLRTDFGLNYFDIELDRTGIKWNYNTVYYCRYVNQLGVRQELTFMLKEPPVLPIPVVEIFVNPIHTDCENLTKSSVDFLGSATNVKYPCRITWYVMNNTQTDLLFLPKEELLASASQTATILVDAFMDYYVVMHVEDACGAVGKQTVHVVCEESSEQVNTVFIQPLRDHNQLSKPNR